MCEQLGVVQPQLMGAQQQFGKIDQAALIANLFIGLINALMGNLKQVFTGGHFVGTLALIFLAVDEPSGLSSGPFFFINVLGFHDALD